MRLVLLGVFSLLGLAITTLESQAAEFCSKDGGDKACFPAYQPPAGDWEYCAGQWYWNYCEQGLNIFDTEEEARNKAVEFNQDDYHFFSMLKTVSWDSLPENRQNGYGDTLVTYYLYGQRYLQTRQETYAVPTPSGAVQNDRILTMGRSRKVYDYQCPEGFQKYYKEGWIYSNPYKVVCYLDKKIKNSCDTTVGNPCSVTTGNKTQSETDWTNSTSPLKVTRTYASLNPTKKNPWSFNATANLTVGRIKDIEFNIQPQRLDILSTVVRLTRPDGTRLIAQREFTDTTLAKSDWFIDRDMSLQLIQINATTWQVKNVRTGITETYTAEPTLTVTDPTSATADTQQPIPSPENYQFNLARIDYPNGQYINYTYQNGLLATATDNLGNSLTYHYTNGMLTQIGLPNGNAINYGYDNLGRLSTVQRPGYGIKTYVYAESDKAPSGNPNLLTGIIDENGKRYATYTYDNQDRGISTEHAGGTQSYKLTYGNDYTYVTDDRDDFNYYLLSPISGTNRINRLITTKHDTKNQYDQAGNLISQTQDGITTKYTYDITRNLEISKIEAFGTPDSRITLTEWASDKPIKTKITEGAADSNGNLSQVLRITSYTYDNQGNPLTKTITDPQTNQSRTWTYTYNTNNQKLTETNPQGQVSKWEYSDKGFLTKSIDAQGLATTYSDLNADGKPQTITSSTGQVTTLTYDEAGRVLTQTVTINTPTLTDVSANQGILSTISNAVASLFSSDSSKPAVKYDISKQATQTATTNYQYDGVGQLIKTTLPDGQTISYSYDDAHRMTGMTDSLGNTISYTLNGAGDIIQTDSKDPQGQLAQISKQTFDRQGHLSTQIGNNGQNQSYSYDNQDNLTSTNDALSRTTSSQYDSLKRKTQDIDANGQPVTYSYNALDQLLTVKDSNNAITTYTYNAFGDVLTTSSPDTGTSTNSYNDKGQLIAQTDGAGRVQNYAYDDKGRLTSRTDSTGKVLASYQYDAYGRLQLMTDTSGRTNYQYNSQNQVIEKKQRTDGWQAGQGKLFTTRYHYTAGGQLDEALLPSGQLVQYQYDKGILKGVLVKTTDGNSTQVIDNISYSPNGIKGYNWSQTKQAVSYQYDLDGRLTAISDPALQRQYQYDAGNRITTLTDSKANLNALFTHDKLDRLTNQTLNTTNNLEYSYDNNSNRTQKVETSNGVAQTSNTAVKANTNQYQAYQYDPSGKTLNDGTRSYTYNSEGRIERIQAGAVGVVNVYNALGQRVQKNSGTAKTYFVYDESGKLISESDTSGNVVREYVYLGNMPIALLSSEKPNAIINVHSDHLGTPRAMTDSTNQVLWRWEGDAFGDVQPQLATVKMPLRMAGQYEDSETGLFYNYFRFYDPKSGRYVENDPIDLKGGLNRYGYVGGSPLMGIDPRGLVKWSGGFGLQTVGFAKFGAGISIVRGTFILKSECINGKQGTAFVAVKGYQYGTGASLLGILSLNMSTVDLYDNLTDVNPDVFNGNFSIGGIGTVFYGVTPIVLGGALGDGTGFGLSSDIFGASMANGESVVFKKDIKDCGCNN